MGRAAAPPLLLLLLLLLLLCFFAAAQPGFMSIDFGGTESYTDEIGLSWVPDQLKYGEVAKVSVPSEKRRQFTTLRYFPADDRKYCYELEVKNRTRYLVRASFLHGNFDKSNVYPKFDVSLGASHWSTIVISNTNTVEVRESILLSSSTKISVCLSNATTGRPFISTLELRQFNGSLYYTNYETRFFLSLSARINFGAQSTGSVRYPDDPFDRLWKSDAIKKANYLVDVAAGTRKVSTTIPIDIDAGCMPPQKVMQTAVVGTEGLLNYRMNLEGFPGFGWAFSYFAEIEDLPSNETRKFRFIIPEPGYAQYSKIIVDVQENAPGKYRLYQPGYPNISLPFVLPFQFKRIDGSTRGPILNALEVYKYNEINYGSLDAPVMDSFVSNYPLEDWAEEGGDPCLPVSWIWVQCDSNPRPRVVSIDLSDRNLTGNIPSALTKLTGLTELWLDGNALTGPVPDFSECENLKKIHLENNQLTGQLPPSLASLPLEELFLQNNMLSGTVPQELINKDMIFNFSGNIHLHQGKGVKSRVLIIIFCIAGASIFLLAAFAYFRFAWKRHKNYSQEDTFSSNATPTPTPTPTPQKLYSFFSEVGKEATTKFTFAELEEATGKFGKRVGSGGYGVVYYGKMEDGKEIAVKVLTNDTYQSNREFSNEVSLLSRIHHRNLVTFLGYCQQNGKNILVYEFMHNGTLKEHLYGAAARKKSISLVQRLEIAEDAAKGLEYLHTGCTPTVIHRDVKSSNILLDKQMRAKVADFGLSKLAIDGSAHVSSIVRGTVGYLDPEYYISQQLTEKSDVYSFGVILLELISGQEAISNDRFGVNCRNIVQWAKSHIENGDIQGIIDPALENNFNLQSIWKIAEKAISCVHPHGMRRPSMSEVLKEIQEAISIERGNNSDGDRDLNATLNRSAHMSIDIDLIALTENEKKASLRDSVLLPAAR